MPVLKIEERKGLANDTNDMKLICPGNKDFYKNRPFEIFFINFGHQTGQMRKWILLPVLIYLSSCKGETEDIYLTPEKASLYFSKIETYCTRDSGRLWGKNLYGPILFVDRTSRRIVANQPDREGLLKLKEGVYTGLYPKENIINNTAIDFGGTLFAMTAIPNEEDEYRIVTRAIHSLFHRFQQQTMGISPASFNALNKDDKEARLWIKLEWRALKKAVSSGGEERQLAVRDALIFRGSNRELYPKNTDEENRFENYEGLATFTYLQLLAESPEEFKTRLLEYLDRIYSFQSYSRSYGSIHGALYAFLLYKKGFDFTTIHTLNVDLGSLVKDHYNIQLPVICRDVAGSIALNYNIDEIYREEETRLQDIRERLNKQVSLFAEKPVVFFELMSPYFDFEPEDVHSLDTLGTLYSKMRVSDNWGKLTVDKGGCLVSNSYKYLRISAKGFKANKNHIDGDGWQLILNNDWEVVEVNQNYLVRKLIP